MDIKFDNLAIYHVDVRYLKYLHDNIDSEVYYSEENYTTKPFLGLVIGIGTYTYFIPFSSSKSRHKKWKNVAPDHYLVYEIVEKGVLSSRAICKPYDDKHVIHIIAALDIKKMIPVPQGYFDKVDFRIISDEIYKAVLEKEYRFCQKIQDGIIERVKNIYEEQLQTGVVHKYFCNFSKLEKACDDYTAK